MDKNIRIPEKEVPVVKETDVIVIGGGVAGIAAAVAAARQGVKVTLIEKSIVLGGLATSGHVCVYLPIDDGNGNKVYGGLAEELLHICIRYSQNNLPEVWKSKPDTAPPDSERYMANFFIPHAVLSLDEFTEKEGVDVVFDAVFSEPIMEGRTVKGVIVESKSGRTAYMAKMFIDAAGDADLVQTAHFGLVPLDHFKYLILPEIIPGRGIFAVYGIHQYPGILRHEGEVQAGSILSKYAAALLKVFYSGQHDHLFIRHFEDIRVRQERSHHFDRTLFTVPESRSVIRIIADHDTVFFCIFYSCLARLL